MNELLIETMSIEDLEKTGNLLKDLAEYKKTLILVDSKIKTFSESRLSIIDEIKDLTDQLWKMNIKEIELNL